MEEAIKVNCDFCGREMECPKDMLAKKQMCHECFYDRAKKGGDDNGPIENVHVDIPVDELISKTAGNMTDEMVEAAFPKIWEERKEELKELSKKELAYEMFGTGAYIALSNLLKLQHMQISEDDDKRDSDI